MALLRWNHGDVVQFEGVRVLVEHELFLLNSTNVASFDSRYFGPIDSSFVRGRAIPLSTSDRQ